MRLPFLQVPQLDLSRGRTLARILRIPEAHGIGLTVALDAWAVDEAPEGDVSGLIRDANPAEAVSLAVGWDGPHEQLLAALVRVKLVEETPEGPCVVSVRRYESALTSPTRRSEHASRAAYVRWHGKSDAPGIGLAMPNDAYTQTQTQTQTQKAFASQEPAVAAPGQDFELTSPSAGKPPRKPSAAERLYAAMQQLRRERCEEVGETFVIEHWASARINRDLGPLAKADDATKALFEAAWGLYLADDGERVREPAWSLSWFMSGGVRARYETRAAREGA